MLLHERLDQGKLIPLLLRVDYIVGFFFVEGAHSPLLNKVRVDNLIFGRASKDFRVE